MKSCQNLLQRTHPIHPIGSNTHIFFAFHSIWVHLRLFRNCKKFSAKRGELVQLLQKFVPRSRVVIIRNERTRSTPLDPNSCFGAFHSVWVRLGSFRIYKLGAKQGRTGAINAKVRATKSRCYFFATNTLDPSHWTLNLCFGAFHSVWVHLGLLRNCMKLSAKQGWTSAINAKVRAMKSRCNFLQQTHSIHVIEP